VTPRVLLLGGLDPLGGAGITADAITLALHGVQAAPVPVVLTVQNRRGFVACEPVAAALWQRMVDAVLDDGPIAAVKTGLLGDVRGVEALAALLARLPRAVPVVVDPVLSATAGGYDAGRDVAAAYRRALLPLATVFTPNHHEAEAVLGSDPATAFALGCGAVLHKGGHGGAADCVDVLHTPRGAVPFVRPRRAIGRVHGTGCALASAIAAHLAHGADVEVACRAAGDWLAGLLATLGPPPADGLPRSLPLTQR
jgi:hydroxymethylpyrimidine/phosphomethylpyrimidine kinase